MNRWSRAVYNALLHAALPLLTPYYLLRAARPGHPFAPYLSTLRGRMGWGVVDTGPEGSVWVHAVSVGEVLAARTLLRALGARWPDVPRVLSSTTLTGLELARSAVAAGEAHAMTPSPLDLPGAVRRAFERVRPRCLVLTEAEMWPNWLHEASSRGLPVALVNARVSARSVRGYHLARWWFRPLFAGLRAVGARTERDAERLLQIGVRPEALAVTGDLKFDVEPSALNRAGARRRFGLPQAGFVVVAGSTHPGEEGHALAAFEHLRRQRHDAVLVIAPRKSMDAPSTSLTIRRRTTGTQVSAGEVLLLDTVGELKDAYVAADLAFVGGSLLPVGGHNMLEPAVAGVPVVFGPHVDNFAAAASQLVTAGGAAIVGDRDALVRVIGELASDESRRAAMGAAAQAAVAAGRGSTRLTLELLAPLLR